MKIVAEPEVRHHVAERGGVVYVWPKASRCCSAVTYTLEAATIRPAKEFELIHASDGLQILATPGLRQPVELHLEVGRRGKLRAFWNGQAWIG